MDADKSFLAALALDPASVEARIGRAMARFDGNRDAEAAGLLDGIPPSPGLEALRSYLSGRATERDLGAPWLARASSIELFMDGMRLAKQAQRGSRHEREALFKLAGARFGEAVNRAPKARAFYQMQRAFACRDGRDDAGVRSAAAALMTLWPDSPRAVFTAGSALYKLDRDAALELVSRSIELDPSWGPPHQILGNIHFFAKRYPEAVAAASEAVRLDPRDADAYNTLGLAQRTMGCVDEAGAAFRAALSLRPNMFESWANLSEVETMRGDDAGTESCLRRALAVQPLDPFPHVKLALLLDNRKEHEEAIDHIVTALALQPQDGWNWYMLGVSVLNLHRDEDGLWAVERAVELEPSDADFRDLSTLAKSRIEKAKAISGAETR